MFFLWGIERRGRTVPRFGFFLEILVRVFRRWREGRRGFEGIVTVEFRRCSFGGGRGGGVEVAREIA